MLVVAFLTVVTLWIAERNVARNAAGARRRAFERDLAALQQVRTIRRAALTERCRSLVHRPRIHAALEDDALDLLYPSANEEMRDVMSPEDPAAGQKIRPLQARFYRFLDAQGAVLHPPDGIAGLLSEQEESNLHLPPGIVEQQIGYLSRRTEQGETVTDEVIASPILSTETNEVIAFLILGFPPFAVERADLDLKSGVLTEHGVQLLGVSDQARDDLAAVLRQRLVERITAPFEIQIDGVPHLAFFRLLNPDSAFPPAHEVCVYSLADSFAKQRQIRIQVISIGAALMAVGLAASHLISSRFSAPVQQLADDSARQQAGRKAAEAALKVTGVELQRAARFSADASHQLKTPVAVMRAGLEALISRADLAEDVHEELAKLIHQTFRLTTMIEDLLLLSRMDAGRMQLQLSPVDLALLMEGLLDDLSVSTADLALEVRSDIPKPLFIWGEQRYTALILQNLLDNARKYNRSQGLIQISATVAEDAVTLSVGNNGTSISPIAQDHIFERFHRGTAAENVAGHGLGLNVARELALLHGGDLRLKGAESDWTEFEVRFRHVQADCPPPSIVDV